MLYKNKIKVQNILKSAVALMLMLTLSLSTALSPLAKAEEAKYTWKTLTSVPASNRPVGVYFSPDGSKLFITELDSLHNTSSLWMSADDGATWRKIFSKQSPITGRSFSADGSKIILRYTTAAGHSYISISTDSGQNWTERGEPDPAVDTLTSPDGSFLMRCDVSGGATVFTIHISTDDGQTWTQKGTNSIGCPEHIFNNGTIIAVPYSNTNPLNKHAIAKSTDYGQTWTEISNFSDDPNVTSFSNNGNTVFDGKRISFDGGNHWTPLNITTLAGGDIVYRVGISDDGKKLFAASQPDNGDQVYTLHTSVDGGRTWRIEKSDNEPDWIIMSSDGSKLFNTHADNNGRIAYRAGILSTPQPVTPGAGAGGTATPSASTSATPGQKPGKASGRLAETGISVQLIGGLAVVAVAAGALVLRKRL